MAGMQVSQILVEKGFSTGRRRQSSEGGGPNVGVHSAPGWSGMLSAHL